MRLQLMTWGEVEEYLRGSQGVIIPVGATEQHGPTGLIGTDAICAESLAWGVGEATGALVAPTISYGMSVHHMNFAGSVTVRPSTLIRVVRDVIVSLARHGFRRLYFINGHGGNTPSLGAAFFEAYNEAPQLIADPQCLRCKAVPWWECNAAKALREELFGARDGDHGAASEISLAAHAYPEHFKTCDALVDPPGSGPVFGPEDFRNRYPDGRMGSHPHLATADHGRRLHEAIVADLSEDYRTFLRQE
jgi:creatinine amidohydrolase